MSRIIIPALGWRYSPKDGWSEISHKIWPSTGFFCWNEAPFALEFDQGISPKGVRVKYEKFTLEAFSFIEQINKGIPSVSILEEQIKERKEITEEEYHLI